MAPAQSASTIAAIAASGFAQAQEGYLLAALALLCPIADITQEITGVPMEPHVTHSVFCAEVEMQLFSFSITDLTTFESVPYQEWVEMEDLPDVGKRFARTMLAANPDFRHRGMCVAIYDEAGKAVSVMPLDPLQ